MLAVTAGAFLLVTWIATKGFLGAGFMLVETKAICFASALLAPDLFILPAFSSSDFFLTLSHRFLKLSDLLA